MFTKHLLRLYTLFLHISVNTARASTNNTNIWEKLKKLVFGKQKQAARIIFN